MVPLIPLRLVRASAFVLRCSASASAAFALAQGLALSHPVWASISSLIVSQDSLLETRRSLVWRIAGTGVGACVAVAVHLGAVRISLAPVWQVAVATAICSFLARERPSIRVCMWTGPLVLLTTSPGVAVGVVALHRAAEVVLGGLVAAFLHWLIDGMFEFDRVAPARDRPSTPPDAD